MRQDALRNELYRSGLKWLAVAAAGLAMLLSMQGGAQADQARKKNGDVRSVYLVKYTVGGEVRYNKGRPGKVLKVSAATYRSGTSYVCTPSGFGQQSRCYRRDFF